MNKDSRLRTNKLGDEIIIHASIAVFFGNSMLINKDDK